MEETKSLTSISSSPNDSFFEDLILSHSTYQIENFILGEEAASTPWGQYKQALREVFQRVRSLKDLIYQQRKLDIEIRKQESLLSKASDEFDKELISLEIEHLQENKVVLDHQIKELTREGDTFLKTLLKLKAVIAELISKGKTKDDLEADFWKTKLKKDLEFSVYTHLGPSIGLLRAIDGLKEPALKIELIGHLHEVGIRFQVDQMNKNSHAVKIAAQAQSQATGAAQKIAQAPITQED